MTNYTIVNKKVHDAVCALFKDEQQYNKTLNEVCSVQWHKDKQFVVLSINEQQSVTGYPIMMQIAISDIKRIGYVENQWNEYPDITPPKLGFYFVKDGNGHTCVAERVREDDICADQVIHWWDTRYYWKKEDDCFEVKYFREIPGDKYQEDNMLCLKE